MDHGFLLIPTAGERTFPGIARKVRLLALRHLLTVDPRSVARPRALADLQRVLGRAARDQGPALLEAVGQPDVLPLLLVSLEGIRAPGETLAVAVPNLLATLGALPEAVLWDLPFEALSDGSRAWVPSAPCQGLTADPSGVSVRDADGRFRLIHELPWSPYPPLRRGVHLATRDTFPLSMLEEHPEKSGNAHDLGGRPEEAWVAALDEALGLVEAGLPTWAADLPVTVRRLVPVGWGPERHLSASYREAPGIAWLTLHPDPLTLAEAIVHETQHGKLNALTWLDPLLHNGRTFWTTSPVRPDLRPLMGVLLAAHAFVPVAALHRALVDHPWPDRDRFARRRAEVLATNARGLDILEANAQPTELGARLLADLRAMHDALVHDAR